VRRRKTGDRGVVAELTSSVEKTGKKTFIKEKAIREFVVS
jgi:hypothetical protein